MPRQARLDAPGILHHVMAIGIEQGAIFRDDHDMEDFIHRLSGLAMQKAWIIYAWALMPNHFHLLIRTGKEPLSRNMRSLMSGYELAKTLGVSAQSLYAASSCIEADGVIKSKDIERWCR